MTNSISSLLPGCLMIDIAGTEMTSQERERICHPLVGGVILFTRNYASPQQLAQLCAALHALRTPPLIISVDHEGGRVQRFRTGFTRLPAMRQLGQLWQQNRSEALASARGVGFVLAAELRAQGVDLSFTPVLDLDYGASEVIGDRSFHRDPAIVAELADALMDGLRQAGMAACGKHFPGHGFVAADSHVAIPVDDRDLGELADDMQPYRHLLLDAVMPAHVIYPRIDQRPAGFSPVWIKKLRAEFKFDGVIFSDDLSMQGASVAGGIIERADAAWAAGCDMLLVCNAPDSVEELLATWRPQPDQVRAKRLTRLVPLQKAIERSALAADERYQAGLRSITRLAAQ
ncbi:MAG: beta-N-acetylhexosaminidase [Proteobacteria bacterium]|nr:beta-N-acetylhexosaminidase [Pseudomonadota bacterium]